MTDFSEKLKEYKYALAVFTDCADFITDVAEDCDWNKLLELRCFDESGEFRAYRSTVDTPFKIRIIDGDKKSDGTTFDGYTDEKQYLDIDSAKTARMNNGVTYATGGGKYHLPVEKAEKLLVRYYFTFDDNGIAKKTDWRLVEFITKEEKE